MGDLNLYQAVILFSWFPFSFALVVMMLIGRFYARFSGKRTYWAYMIVPLILYAVATVREARVAHPGDPLADVLFGLGGGGLLFIIIRLYRWMMQKPISDVSPLPPSAFLALPVFGTAILGIIGPIAIAILIWMLGRYSQRMHHVLEGRSYFYGYYLAAGAVAFAALLRLPVILNPDWALAYAVSLALGCGLSAAMSWRAWSWLLAERE